MPIITSCSRRTLSGLIALGLLAGSAHAQIYNATTDFGIASNPLGVWTYGFSSTLGGSLTLFDTTIAGPPFVGWAHSTVNDLGTPTIAKNISGGSLFGIPDGFVTLHPGASTLTVLRFTAPTTNSYSLASQFFSGDGGETTGFVLHNGATLFSDTTTSDNPTFNTVVSLLAGDTLDIVVGQGSDGYFSDNTPVAATLSVAGGSSAPEPGTVVLLLAGTLVCCRRRKRPQ